MDPTPRLNRLKQANMFKLVQCVRNLLDHFADRRYTYPEACQYITETIQLGFRITSANVKCARKLALDLGDTTEWDPRRYTGRSAGEAAKQATIQTHLLGEALRETLTAIECIARDLGVLNSITAITLDARNRIDRALGEEGKA